MERNDTMSHHLAYGTAGLLAGQIDEATGKLKIINVLKGQIQELKQNQEVKTRKS
jgi:hypothetical protein